MQFISLNSSCLLGWFINLCCKFVRILPKSLRLNLMRKFQLLLTNVVKLWLILEEGSTANRCLSMDSWGRNGLSRWKKIIYRSVHCHLVFSTETKLFSHFLNSALFVVNYVEIVSPQTEKKKLPEWEILWLICSIAYEVTFLFFPLVTNLWLN